MAEASERLRNLDSSLWRVVLLSVVVHGILFLVQGPAWAKRGVFFHGIKSQEDFWVLTRQGYACEADCASQHVLAKVARAGTADVTEEAVLRVAAGAKRVKFQWGAVPEVVDDEGTRLCVRAAQLEQGLLCWIRLPCVRKRAMELRVNRRSSMPIAALSQEGVWTYCFQYSHGRCQRFTHTVVLPCGSTVLNCSPSMPLIAEDSMGTTLMFQERSTDAGIFTCVVTYRVAQ